MEWYHIFMVAYIVIAAIGVLLSESCLGLILGSIMVGLLVLALNSAGFWA